MGSRVIIRSEAARRPGHSAHVLVVRAQTLLLRGDRAAALSVAQEAAASADVAGAAVTHADLARLATVLTRCDAPHLALPLLRRSIASRPDDPALLYNLAATLRMTGDLRGAEAAADRVLELRPDDDETHYLRSALKQQTPDDNHLDQLRARTARRERHGRGGVGAFFALAKELDDLGRCDEAFDAWARGNRLQRLTFRYEVARDVLTLQHLARVHDADAVQAAPRGEQAREPIFICGLPRTGTTLLERMLAGHAAIRSAGELDAFARSAVAEVGHVSKEDFVERALEVDPARLGRRYLAAARPHAGTGAHFIDKMPLNALYLGLIRRSLPNARLILVCRDPMDACFAMYRTLFAQAYPFSYDLEELGRYSVAWHALMRHWRAVLGEHLLVVHYEELVGDPRATLARVLRHCRLPWQESCLAFHTSVAPATTASAVQVRRPVYRTSVGAWRRYARHLGELTRWGVAAAPATDTPGP